MADKRKLQGEVDRVLKKVAEGAEAFQEIWQKVQNAANTNQKDKYEAELKREIKKLQRLREQIKTWATSSDIKDKKILLENRRLIEQQMEKFRIVEKETKTKAYSKEGLGQASKVDPAALELEQCTEWINDVIQKLTLQIDTFEAEIESLHQANRRKKLEKDKQDRVDELQEMLTKHKHHITQLECILRKLDNESLEVDKVNKLKEDIEYYIENCQEPDFAEDEGIYDELELDIESDNLIESIRGFEATTDLEDDLPSSPGSSVTSSNFSLVSGSPASKSLNNSPRKNSKSVNGTTLPPPSTAVTTAPPTTASKRNLFGTTTAQLPVSSMSGTSSQADSLLQMDNAGGIDHFSDFPSQQQAVSSLAANFQPQATGLIQQQQPNSLLMQNNNSLLMQQQQSQQPRMQISSTLSSSSAPFTPAASLAPTPANQHVSVAASVPSDSPMQLMDSTPQEAVLNHVDSMKGFSGFNAVSSAGMWTSSASPNLLSMPQTSGIGQSQAGDTSTVTTTTDTQPSVELSPGLMQSMPGIAGHQQWSGGENVNPQQSGSPLLANVLSSQNLPSAQAQLPQQTMAGPTGLANTAGVAAFMPIISSMTQQQQKAGEGQSAQQQPQQSLPHMTSTPPPPSGTGLPSSLSADFGFKQNSLFGGMMNLPGTGINKLGVGSGANQQVTQEVHLQPVHGVAPLGPVLLTSERLFQLKMLEAAYHHLPQKQDSERMRPYFTRSSVPIASYHHHQPPANIDSLEFFQRLSTETLFFIFYYQEGTRAQYLAAKALKKQSWRFHTKYMMWFQRHEEPKRITDEYEEGTYIFFDYEKWSQRKRDGFTFEYRFLEDKDLP